MEAYNAIITKRDLRDYAAKLIDERIVHEILQAGRMAGTAANRQPCRLIVLNDRPTLEALAPAGVGTRSMLSAPLSIAIAVRDNGMAFDVGRVAQNMMVAAWAEGVTSCPQAIQDQEIARSALKMPADFSVGMCIAFGYPSASPPSVESRPRLPFEDMVHWGAW